MMTGIIQEDGSILGNDGKLYYSSIQTEDSILLACSSFSRYKIIDVWGKRVEFEVSLNGRGYNYKLI